MKTLKRICIKNHTVSDRSGNSMTVERGHEYITTPDDNGECVVFGPYWAPFPVNAFAGEERFT